VGDAVRTGLHGKDVEGSAQSLMIMFTLFAQHITLSIATLLIARICSGQRQAGM
jgi:hypothetical protein